MKSRKFRVGTRRKTRRRYSVDHCPVAQHGQIEAVAVERDELRAQGRDFIAERGDQLLLSPIANRRRADGDKVGHGLQVPRR